jgi:hypothetical protein
MIDKKYFGMKFVQRNFSPQKMMHVGIEPARTQYLLHFICGKSPSGNPHTTLNKGLYGLKHVEQKNPQVADILRL